MKSDEVSIEATYEPVRDSARGLSAAEAKRRLAEYGPNRIEKIAREPILIRLAKEFFQSFSIILWIAAALAFVAEWSKPGEGMARIGIAIIIVIVVSGLFSFWQEYRMEQTLAALQRLLPPKVKVHRDDTTGEVSVDELVVGDLVLISQGDNIPADCRLIQAFGVRVNNAIVTGESAPQARSAEPSREHDPLRSSNILLAGTAMVSGQAKALVYATGAATEFGKIARLTQAGAATVSPLRLQLAHLSRVIVILAIAIGAIFFAIGVLIDVPFWQDFIFAIGIIVAMVPEGLQPTLTLALVLAAQRLARRNVLVRHLASVETLGAATVICTDKTGTLTENRMHVRELWPGRGPRSTLAADGMLAPAQEGDLLLCAALCHELRESRRGSKLVLLGDPMEVALVEMARKALPEIPASRRIHEIPFDTDRMRQSVVQDFADGPILYCKGAPETVLPLCRTARAGGDGSSLDDRSRKAIVEVQEEMAERGLRVLACGMRRLPPKFEPDRLEQDLVFLGLVGLEDPPRPEVAAAIQKCRDAGVRIIMTTGDHPRTAVAVARETGLVKGLRPSVITGSALRHLSQIELEIALDEPEILFARVAADQKLRIVEALKNKQHVVAVTGDGVNDAPALKAAHIGIAMGLSGTDVAKEASDMVLLDDNFASIVQALEESRAVFSNIRKFLTYVLVHNVAELVPYLAFALLRIPLPLTPIQALSVDMGTDSLAALGLGIERPNPNVMRLPPRPQKERLLNLPVALRAYLCLGVIEATAAMAAYFFVLWRQGWRFGQDLAPSDPLYLQASTACLSAIVVLQVVNVFLCRSSVRSVFVTGFFDNPLILGGVALEIAILLFISYTPWGNALIGTMPVPAELWLFLLPFAAAMLLCEEARKWLVRRVLRPMASRRRRQ
jgi:calcium-translocating P-type ATPase